MLESMVVLNSEWSKTRLCCCSRSVSGPDGLAHGTYLQPWYARYNYRQEKETFSDLDFADDVALFAEMLSVFVLTLEVMNAEAQPLGMSTNWTKTKIQNLGGCDAPCQRVIVQGNEVEVVESFTYLGSLIHCSDGSELETKRRATIASESMFALEQNIWRSSITLETKLRLYNVCILPIFLYGSEVRSVTSTLSKKIDALDNWCLRRILHIHWTDFVSNDEVRSRTGQPFLSDTIRRRRLSFFGHPSRADISQDHSRVLQAFMPL